MSDSSPSNAETFTERFNRLTAGVSDAELMRVLELSYHAVRKLRLGDTKTLKFDSALRLCRRLGIDPWDLAGEPGPPTVPLLTDATHQQFSPLVAIDKNDPLLNSRMGAALHAQVVQMQDRLSVVEPQAAEVVTALREMDTIRRAMLALLDALELQQSDRQSVAAILEPEREDRPGSP